MSKGNLFQGMARGKIGDVVFYRANGEQVSRVRNRAPKNPKSAKQALQRMTLATAAKMASAYEPIVNHSFETIEVGNKSVNFFRSLAMRALRTAAATAINGETTTTRAEFAIKGAPIVGSVEGLPISRGSLSFVPVSLNIDGNPRVAYAPATSIATQEQYVAELAKLGLEPGDQLTIVQQFSNINTPVATFENETNYAQAVRYARVVFAPVLPAEFSGALIVNGAFNPALLAESLGSISATIVEGNLELNIPGTLLGVSQCACLIRSQKQPNGSFKYSSANMLTTDNTFDFNNAPEVYPSYMEGASDIQVGDSLYLRNAVAAPLA